MTVLDLGEMRECIESFSQRVSQCPTGLDAQKELELAREELRTQLESLYEQRLLLTTERYKRHLVWTNMRESCVVTDHQGLIVEGNKAAATLFNVPIDFLPGKPFANFLHPDVKTLFRMSLHRMKKVDLEERWDFTVTPRRAKHVFCSVYCTTSRCSEKNLRTCSWFLLPVKVEVT